MRLNCTCQAPRIGNKKDNCPPQMAHLTSNLGNSTEDPTIQGGRESRAERGGNGRKLDKKRMHSFLPLLPLNAVHNLTLLQETFQTEIKNSHLEKYGLDWIHAISFEICSWVYVKFHCTEICVGKPQHQPPPWVSKTNTFLSR